MPGFCKPIALSMPAGVCTSRGVGLPNRGSRVTLLSTMAPIFERSTNGANSSPEP